MPDFPKVQRQKWVTLPQALRWIMAREEPTPENWGTLPTFPDGDTSRGDLFHHWIGGRLKLYGLDGFDPRRPQTPLTSSLTYSDDCQEHTDCIRIDSHTIIRAGFESIEWERGSLGRFFIEDGEDECPYFVDLRVRWDALHALTTEGKSSGTDRKLQGSFAGANQGGHGSSKRRLVAPPKGRSGRIPRADWPLLAALSAIVGERKFAFWAISKDDKLDLLRPILEAAGHLCPSNPILPGRTLFGEIVLAAVKEAKVLIAEQRSPDLPLSPDSLSLVAALVAIVREHDREPGEVSCENEMSEQVKLMLNVAADAGPGNFFEQAGSSLYEEAKVATRRANEVHEGFCQKHRPRPI